MVHESNLSEQNGSEQGGKWKKESGGQRFAVIGILIQDIE